MGFTDNLIFDAPGQDDLFIQEQGGGLELGEVWVSPDGVNFTFLDTLNGPVSYTHLTLPTIYSV